MFVRHWTCCVALPACLILCMLLVARGEENWPTYRYDARRSGFSPHELPAGLELHWQRRLPRYEVAFPNEPRKQFDASHEPVCADGVLVVGCPADGSVRAYAADNHRSVAVGGPSRGLPAEGRCPEILSKLGG